MRLHIRDMEERHDLANWAWTRDDDDIPPSEFTAAADWLEGIGVGIHDVPAPIQRAVEYVFEDWLEVLSADRDDETPFESELIRDTVEG